MQINKDTGNVDGTVYHPHQNLEENTPLESMLNDNKPNSKNSSRIFYITPYGEAHLRMPTIEYLRNEEKRLWTWYTPKIAPYALLLLLFTIPFAYSQGYGHCPYGHFPYGKGCAQVVKTPEGGAGGGQPITANLTDLFGIPSSEGECNIKYQLFENRCYPCDPSIGYLRFNPDDRSILCVSCGNGFLLNGTDCIPEPTTKNQVIKFFDYIAKTLSSVIKTDNMAIGYFIAFTLFVVGVYYGYHWFFIKKPGEKSKREIEKEEEKEEEN